MLSTHVLNYLFLQYSIFLSSPHFPPTLSQKMHSTKCTGAHKEQLTVRTQGAIFLQLKACNATIDLIDILPSRQSVTKTELFTVSYPPATPF